MPGQNRTLKIEYGSEKMENRKPSLARQGFQQRRSFVLQWHVTARCENRCVHCYLQDSEGYRSEIENELSLEDCFRVVDDLYQTTRAWNVGGRIYFTGGDPLLKAGIFDLIAYAHKRGFSLGILGNPEPLNYKTALRLKESGVTRYQVSIDGMEQTHDGFRSEGSFERTLKGIEVLNRMGIPSVVMFTLSKQNAKELILVINLLAKMGVRIFDFARLVPIGSGAQLKEEMLEPEEYRELLLNVLEEYKRLKEEGCDTYFGRKENLWKLLYQQLGLFPPLSEDKKTIFLGCSIGISSLTIIADGTVYPCRRLPIAIGKVPEESLRDIFINSPILNEMREVEKMEKCGRCELLQYCRGCPAVAHAVSGQYFAPDPQCWREI